MAKGKRRLERALSSLLNKKEDKLQLFPAALGAYVNGQQTIVVASRHDFVYCRLRGSTSEQIIAFNDKVGSHWDLPILVYRDPMAPDIWKVYGRDIRQYADWDGLTYLVSHGRSHSFAGEEGHDPVWVVKSQYMPMLPRPAVSGSMSIYIEPDFYYFNSQFHYWPGSGTSDLTSYKPTGAFDGRFVTVYINAQGNPDYLLGDEFYAYIPPTDPGDYIAIPQADEGVPLVAVWLLTGTERIGWGELYDLRSPQQAVVNTTGTFKFIYDDGVLQGNFTAIDFEEQLKAVMTGSVAYVSIEPPVTGSLVLFDEGVILGSVLGFNFTGDNVEAVISGSYGHVMITGTAGGGGGGSGSIIIEDESLVLGSADTLNFLGTNVSVIMDGDTANITVLGTVGTGSLYIRAGQAVSLYDDPTSQYWKIPEGTYATGTLAIGINGVWQIPVLNYDEQYPQSGTFSLDSAPPTGTLIGAIWATLDPNYGVSTPVTGSIVLSDEGAILGSITDLQVYGDGLEAGITGTVGYITYSGTSAGGSNPPVTGSIVLSDEGDILGSITHLDIVGSTVEAVVSGTVGYLMHSGSAGGGSEPPVSGSFVVYDEGIILGSALGLNVAGTTGEVVLSGTVAHLMLTGSTGGSNPPITGSTVIFDEGVVLGSALGINFTGDNVEAVISGSYVHVMVTGSASGGGTPVVVTTGTFYIEEVLYEVTLTSATGSVVAAGLSQDYDDLRYIVHGKSGAPFDSMPVSIIFNGDQNDGSNYNMVAHWLSNLNHSGSYGTGSIIGYITATNSDYIDEFDYIMGNIPDYADATKRKVTISESSEKRNDSHGLYVRQNSVHWDTADPINIIEFVDAGTFVSGTHVKVIGIKNTVVVTDVTGGGSSNPPVTGSMVIFDEGVNLGSALGINFSGDNVEAVISGSYAHVMITGSAGGGGVDIYDASGLLGSAENIVIGDNLTVVMTGTYAYLRGGGEGSDAVIIGYSTDTGLSPISCAVPTGTMAGDLAVMAVCTRNSVIDCTDGPENDGSWTAAWCYDTGTDEESGFWWKILDGTITGTASIDVTVSDGGAGALVIFRTNSTQYMSDGANDNTNLQPILIGSKTGLYLGVWTSNFTTSNYDISKYPDLTEIVEVARGADERILISYGLTHYDNLYTPPYFPTGGSADDDYKTAGCIMFEEP